MWLLAGTYELLASIQRNSTLDGICNCVLSYAAKFGAKHLLAGTIPPPGASKQEQLSHVLLDAWPEEWSQRYFSNGYLHRDPAIRLVSRTSAPFDWSDVEALCKVCPVGRRIMEEAADFRLCNGLTFAFSTVEREAIGFSIAGEKFEADPCERQTLQLVAAFALGCAVSLSGMQRKQCPVHLSPRQRDVLHCASDGLTVDQTAARLQISRNTADTHLRAVRARFGVASTAHAVAEGFRRGLIT